MDFKMTPEQEKQYREDFEEYFAATKPYQFSILKDKKKTEFEISKLKFSIGYVSARKKAEEEISQLKEEIDKLNNKTKNIETNRMFWVNETCKLKNTFGVLKEIKRYPTALGYISEIKEELERKKVFISKFEFQISKGYPTANEWHLLATEFQKQRK